jgi:hypothetical protein
MSTRQKKKALVMLGVGIVQLAMMQEEEEEEEEQVVQRRRETRRRRWWVRPWISRRLDFGAYDQLMRELEDEDVTSFTNFLRFTPEGFRELLDTVGPHIQKQDTFWRKALPAGLKLAVTLRYMATGDSYKSLGYVFRVPCNTISVFVPVVCQAIQDCYADEQLSCPITEDGWRQVAEEFETRWNFPHCCGALDGKHVAIKRPSKSGSLYYNYKGFFSVVLMALVDANYKFIYVECGYNGASSDGGVFSQTDLQEALEDRSINLPKAAPLPGVTDNTDVPYFIVGDEAFPLKNWLMKPLPQRNMTVQQRIYNYRLSRARRVVENGFGLLAARFRCLLTTMPQKPSTVNTIVLAACCLHNLLINRRLNRAAEVNLLDHEDAETHEVTPGTWRDIGALPDLGDVERGSYGPRQAREQREYLVQYVNSPAGSVPWQHDKI